MLHGDNGVSDNGILEYQNKRKTKYLKTKARMNQNYRFQGRYSVSVLVAVFKFHDFSKSY